MTAAITTTAIMTNVVVPLLLAPVEPAEAGSHENSTQSTLPFPSSSEPVVVVVVVEEEEDVLVAVVVVVVIVELDVSVMLVAVTEVVVMEVLEVVVVVCVVVVHSPSVNDAALPSHPRQSRSAVAVASTKMYCPATHWVIGVHSRSACPAEGCRLSNSPSAHSVCDWHT